MVVDLDAAARVEDEEFVPLAKGVADGFAGEAEGQVVAPGQEVVEPGFDFLEDGRTVGFGVRSG